MASETRRDFLGRRPVGAGGDWARLTGSAAQRSGDGPKKAKNDQPTIGYIGTGIRYHEDLGHTAVKFGPARRSATSTRCRPGRGAAGGV